MQQNLTSYSIQIIPLKAELLISHPEIDMYDLDSLKLHLVKVAIVYLLIKEFLKEPFGSKDVISYYRHLHHWQMLPDFFPFPSGPWRLPI